MQIDFCTYKKYLFSRSSYPCFHYLRFLAWKRTYTNKEVYVWWIVFAIPRASSCTHRSYKEVIHTRSINEMLFAIAVVAYCEKFSAWIAWRAAHLGASWIKFLPEDIMERICLYPVLLLLSELFHTRTVHYWFLQVNWNRKRIWWTLSWPVAPHLQGTSQSFSCNLQSCCMVVNNLLMGLKDGMVKYIEVIVLILINLLLLNFIKFRLCITPSTFLTADTIFDLKTKI